MSATFHEARGRHAARLAGSLGLTDDQALREVGFMARDAASRLGVDAGAAGDGGRMAPELMSALESSVERRLAGDPLAHVLGCEEFMGLTFACGPGVLTPRPETETLVEWVVESVTAAAPRIADLGAGSGCVSVALAKALPDAKVVACESDPVACEVARKNAGRHGTRNVEVVETGWTELVGEFDVVVSNPPYVTSALCDRGGTRDPRAALDGGPDGLDAYRSILGVANRLLVGDGDAFFEHGVGQHVEIARIAAKEGFQVAGHRRDMQGLRRALLLRAAG